MSGPSSSRAREPAAPTPIPGNTRQWVLRYQLPGGLVVGLYAPETLTHDQVLQIAAQVVYTA